MREVGLWAALFAAFGVGAMAFELRREIVPFWRLFLGPVSALVAALLLPAEPRWLATAIAGLLIGMVAGSVRGLSAALRVDHVWGLLRMRRGTYDGVAFALCISVVIGADTAPTVSYLLHHAWSVPFATVAFGCAGYLLGRAGTIGLRARSAPHDDMRPVPGRR